MYNRKNLNAKVEDTLTHNGTIRGKRIDKLKKKDLITMCADDKNLSNGSTVIKSFDIIKIFINSYSSRVDCLIGEKNIFSDEKRIIVRLRNFEINVLSIILDFADRNLILKKLIFRRILSEGLNFER